MPFPRSSRLVRSALALALGPVLASSFVVACQNDDEPGPGTVVNPTLPTVDAGDAAGELPTFTRVYTNVLATRCSPCHTTALNLGITQGALDMTTQARAYGALYNVPAAGSACAGLGIRVVPFEPNNSLLFLKVSPDAATPCGSKMPLNAAPLSASEADLIERWIAAGALDD